MKKFYSLLLASLMVSAGFAQTINLERLNSTQAAVGTNLIVTEDLRNESSMIQMQAEVSTAEAVSVPVTDMPAVINALRNSTRSELFVDHELPFGAFFHGFTRDWRAFADVRLHVPAFRTVDFVPWTNDAAAAIEWTIAGGPIPSFLGEVQDNGTLSWNAPINWWLMPIVTATNAGGSVSYQLGQATAGNSVVVASDVRRMTTDDGSAFDGQEEFFALMTMANMRARHPAGNLFSGFTPTGDLRPEFGPQYVHPTSGRVTGVMQVIPRLSAPLFVESVTAVAIVDDMPAGGVLRLRVYYMNENGTLGELIGEATTDSFFDRGDGGGAFTFVFEIRIGGFEIPTPITIGTGRDVAVIIDGFDERWDFTFAMGQAGPDGSGHTAGGFTLHGPTSIVHTFVWGGTSIPRMNMYIQFNGIFNVLQWAGELFVADYWERMEFPEAGGWGVASTEGFEVIPVYSAFEMGSDIWIEEKPDWITGWGYDDELFDEYDVIFFGFYASALPSGVTGRSGEIVIASHGISLTIPVTQGDVEGVSITNPAAPRVSVFNTPSSFELTYTADFTSVAVYSISGQRVALHNLPPTGNFSLPTYGLPRGAYIVRFIGNSVETVKVIR